MKRKIYCLVFLLLFVSFAFTLYKSKEQASYTQYIPDNFSKTQDSLDPQVNKSRDSSIEELLIQETKSSNNIVENHSNSNAFYFEGENLENLKVIILRGDGTKSEEIPIHENHDLFESNATYTTEVSQLFYEKLGIASVEVIEKADANYKIKFIQENTDISTQNASTQALNKNYKKRLFQSLGLNVITREEWGAPSESYWSPWITDVNRIVVHHTATGVDWDDPSRTVRTIYNFHFYRCSNNNGSYDPNREDCNEPDEIWNDIGYNYLIDPYGHIYEGRAGGNGVVGAHAIPNAGSIGIGMLGDYTGSLPSHEALQSLERLTGVLSKLNDFVPIWQTSFYGHRDYMATACPGNTLYANLPSIATSANYYLPANIKLNEAVNYVDQKLQMDNIIKENSNVRLFVSKYALTSDEIQMIKANYRGQIKQWETNNFIFFMVPESIVHQFMVENYLSFPNGSISPDRIVNTFNKSDSEN